MASADVIGIVKNALFFFFFWFERVVEIAKEDPKLFQVGKWFFYGFWRTLSYSFPVTGICS